MLYKLTLNDSNNIEIYTKDILEEDIYKIIYDMAIETIEENGFSTLAEKDFVVLKLDKENAERIISFEYEIQDYIKNKKNIYNSLIDRYVVNQLPFFDETKLEKIKLKYIKYFKIPIKKIIDKDNSRIWNSKACANNYERIEREAKKNNINIDLNKVYLNELLAECSNENERNLVIKAYYLGQVRSLKRLDDGFTPVKLSDIEVMR